jgi:small subunit ribosomal protein S1
MSEQSNEPQDFAALLDAFEKEQQQGAAGQGPGRDKDGKGRRGPSPGDKVAGTIVGFGEMSAFVDLGGKTEGSIPLPELTDAEGKRSAAVGDRIEAMVVAIDDDAGTVLLRVRGAGQGPAVPAEILQAHQHGLPVDGTVQAVVKGGVEVNVHGIRGFCPISQLDNRFVDDATAATYVGKKLEFRVSRYEPGGRGRGPNVVLSRRSLLEEQSAARAEEALKNLAPGKIVRGTVTSLASYGAFVDLGGIEGLLHVSELGHSRIAHPQEVLAVGQEVEVQVKEIVLPKEGEPEPREEGKGRRRARGPRISLSRRALLRDPWDEEVAKLQVGTRRTGRVARLESFGAFIELAPGVDGLLHVSELGGGRQINHPREAVRPGDTIVVAVQSVDRERRRISLVVAGETAGEGDARDLAQTQQPEGFGALGDFLKRTKKSD